MSDKLGSSLFEMIIDIEGKEEITCPKCGFVMRVEPRELSLESLEHMKKVNELSKMLDEKVKSPDRRTLNNLRLFACLQCDTPLLCKDRFSSTA